MVGPDMLELLKVSVREFKTTMINMSKSLMDKIYSMQEHIGNIIRKMEILKKELRRKEMLEIENTVVEAKNAFDWLTSWLETIEERISEVKYIKVNIYIYICQF